MSCNGLRHEAASAAPRWFVKSFRRGAPRNASATPGHSKAELHTFGSPRAAVDRSEAAWKARIRAMPNEHCWLVDAASRSRGTLTFATFSDTSAEVNLTN